jgi:hypothetical protein
MSIFKAKPIEKPSEKAANAFRVARENRHLTLGEVAAALSINERYLKAIEADDQAALPPGVYTRQFRKSYAAYLGITDAAWARADKEAIDDPFSRRVPAARYFLAIPKLVRNLIIAAGIAIFIGYLGYYASTVTAPPLITLSEPVADQTVETDTIAVRGATDPEAEVRINNELILSTPDGSFSTIVNLRPGINTITITVKRRFGRSATAVRKILSTLTAPTAPALPNSPQ